MLPDKRFTFDLDRRNTILSDWIGWYLEKLERPSPRQVFDHFSNVRDVSSAEVWDDPSHCGAGNIHQMSEALVLRSGPLANSVTSIHIAACSPPISSSNCAEGCGH